MMAEYIASMSSMSWSMTLAGSSLKKRRCRFQITVTMAIPEEDRQAMEEKFRKAGGKTVEVPLAGSEIAVVAPTLGRHHMPHPTCDIPEQLRREDQLQL